MGLIREKGSRQVRDFTRRYLAARGRAVGFGAPC
jgi:hypothetical protein